MDDIIKKVYHGYNNYYDLKNKFYDFLSKELRNEPNKIQFLKQLISNLELEYVEEQKNCKKPNCTCKLDLKETAIKIINVKINEIEKDKLINHFVNVDNSINKNIVKDSNGVTINQNSNNHINLENKENWFKKNVKYIYYTGAVVIGGYSLYKWILSLF